MAVTAQARSSVSALSHCIATRNHLSANSADYLEEYYAVKLSFDEAPRLTRLAAWLYIDFRELAVSRRHHRSGGSESVWKDPPLHSAYNAVLFEDSKYFYRKRHWGRFSNSFSEQVNLLCSHAWCFEDSRHPAILKHGYSCVRTRNPFRVIGYSVDNLDSKLLKNHKSTRFVL